MEPLTYDDNDLQSLALCAWKEARGDGSDGMEAVMCVIVNRVGAPGFAHTLHDVIYGRNQFTSMSVPSDPEFNLVPDAMDSQYRVAQQLAYAVLNATLTDVTNGATYYANLATMDNGGWFDRVIVAHPELHPQVAVIGHHTFYK